MPIKYYLLNTYSKVDMVNNRISQEEEEEYEEDEEEEEETCT